MMNDPEWVKNHMALAIVLDVLSEVIFMALAFFSGKAAFANGLSGASGGVASALRVLIPTLYVSQGVQAASTIASGVEGAVG